MAEDGVVAGEKGGDSAGNGLSATETNRDEVSPSDATESAAVPSDAADAAEEGRGGSLDAEGAVATESDEEQLGEEQAASEAGGEVLEELVGRSGAWFGDRVSIEAAEKRNTRELDALGGEHLSHLYRVVVALDETPGSRSESCELVLAGGMTIAAFVEAARGERTERKYEFVFFHDGDAALAGARFVVKRPGSEPVEVSLGEFTE